MTIFIRLLFLCCFWLHHSCFASEQRIKLIKLQEMARSDTMTASTSRQLMHHICKHVASTGCAEHHTFSSHNSDKWVFDLATQQWIISQETDKPSCMMQQNSDSKSAREALYQDSFKPCNNDLSSDILSGWIFDRESQRWVTNAEQQITLQPSIKAEEQFQANGYGATKLGSFGEPSVVSSRREYWGEKASFPGQPALKQNRYRDNQTSFSTMDTAPRPMGGDIGSSAGGGSGPLQTIGSIYPREIIEPVREMSDMQQRQTVEKYNKAWEAAERDANAADTDWSLKKLFNESDSRSQESSNTGKIVIWFDDNPIAEAYRRDQKEERGQDGIIAQEQDTAVEKSVPSSCQTSTSESHESLWDSKKVESARERTKEAFSQNNDTNNTTNNTTNNNETVSRADHKSEVTVHLAAVKIAKASPRVMLDWFIYGAENLVWRYKECIRRSLQDSTFKNDLLAYAKAYANPVTTELIKGTIKAIEILETVKSLQLPHFSKNKLSLSDSLHLIATFAPFDKNYKKALKCQILNEQDKVLIENAAKLYEQTVHDTLDWYGLSKEEIFWFNEKKPISPIGGFIKLKYDSCPGRDHLPILQILQKFRGQSVARDFVRDGIFCALDRASKEELANRQAILGKELEAVEFGAHFLVAHAPDMGWLNRYSINLIGIARHVLTDRLSKAYGAIVSSLKEKHESFEQKVLGGNVATDEIAAHEQVVGAVTHEALNAIARQPDQAETISSGFKSALEFTMGALETLWQGMPTIEDLAKERLIDAALAAASMNPTLAPFAAAYLIGTKAIALIHNSHEIVKDAGALYEALANGESWHEIGKKFGDVSSHGVRLLIGRVSKRIEKHIKKLETSSADLPKRDAIDQRCVRLANKGMKDSSWKITKRQFKNVVKKLYPRNTEGWKQQRKKVLKQCNKYQKKDGFCNRPTAVINKLEAALERKEAAIKAGATKNKIDGIEWEIKGYLSEVTTTGPLSKNFRFVKFSFSAEGIVDGKKWRTEIDYELKCRETGKVFWGENKARNWRSMSEQEQQKLAKNIEKKAQVADQKGVKLILISEKDLTEALKKALGHIPNVIIAEGPWREIK